MSEHKEPIPSMIYNAAVGGHVTNSQQIIDENLNREQQDINEEVAAVPYNATTPNGMGKIVLKKNDNFKQVVEAQTDGNTIFVIKYDFTLTGDVTVPANCVLEFDGGSISGEYTLTGNNTGINAGLLKIFNIDVTFAGTWNIVEAYLEWFGAKGDGVTDDTECLNKAYSLCTTVNIVKTYLIDGFTMSNAGTLYSKTKGGIILSNPIVVTKNYSKVVGLAMRSADRDNRVDCIVFDGGQGSAANENYHCFIKDCMLQLFKNVFVIEKYSANIYIEGVVTNNSTGKFLLAKNNVNLRYNIVFNDCFILGIKGTFIDAHMSNMYFNNCYVNVNPISYYVDYDLISELHINGCLFENVTERSSGANIALFYTRGAFIVNNSAFVSNKAVNTFWFGLGSFIQTIFDINNTSFRDYSPENKMQGTFYPISDLPKYGRIKFDNVKYGQRLIEIPEHLSYLNLNKNRWSDINIVNGIGTFVFNTYTSTPDKLVVGTKYNLYDYTSRNLIGKGICKEALNEVLTSGGTIYNTSKYISNTLQQGKRYRALCKLSAVSTFHLFFAKSNNVTTSGDDIATEDGYALTNKTNIAGENFITVDFVAPDSSEYPYIKLVNDVATWALVNFYEITNMILDEDGELVGIAHSGTFANVPSPINKGFAYFATDKGQAGVGAMIYYTGDNTTPWVYADGTAVS